MVAKVDIILLYSFERSNVVNGWNQSKSAFKNAVHALYLKYNTFLTIIIIQSTTISVTRRDKAISRDFYTLSYWLGLGLQGLQGLQNFLFTTL